MLFISVISSHVPLASTIIILVALIGGLVGYLYWPFWKLRKVPGPPSLPLVGHLPLLAKYGPDVFSVLAKQYGPIYRFLYCTCIHTIYHFICFLPPFLLVLWLESRSSWIHDMQNLQTLLMRMNFSLVMMAAVLTCEFCGVVGQCSSGYCLGKKYYLCIWMLAFIITCKF